MRKKRLLMGISLLAAALVLGGCGSNQAKVENKRPVDPAGRVLKGEELLAFEREHLYYENPITEYDAAKFQAVGPMGFGLLYADLFENSKRQLAMRAGQGDTLGAVLDWTNLGLNIFDANFTFAPGWFSVMSLMQADHGAYAKRKTNSEVGALSNPTLEFFKLLPPLAEEVDPMDEFGPSMFTGGTLFDRAPLDCKPRGVRKGSGGIVEPVGWGRAYYCSKGRPDSDFDEYQAGLTSATIRRLNKHSPLVKDGGIPVGSRYARAKFHFLNLIPGWEDPDAARRLHAILAPYTPPGWYAMYTGEDENGNWKVFVTKGGVTRAFDPPGEKS
ncbi:MAG: hypothetical protein ABFS02_07420 [Pseudomonadota bacterium]